MENMNASETIVFLAEQNELRKVLEILSESKDLEDAKQKVKALLK